MKESAKSSNHKIMMNHGLPSPGKQKMPYKLMWTVKRQGSSPGFPVQMHRTSDREGAEEFAARWGVKMPKSTP